MHRALGSPTASSRRRKSARACGGSRRCWLQSPSDARSAPAAQRPVRGADEWKGGRGAACPRSGPVEGVRGNREVPPASMGEPRSGPVEGVRGNREGPPDEYGGAADRTGGGGRGAACPRSGPVEGVWGNGEI